jgi:hypothetical protein
MIASSQRINLTKMTQDIKHPSLQKSQQLMYKLENVEITVILIKIKRTKSRQLGNPKLNLLKLENLWIN